MKVNRVWLTIGLSYRDERTFKNQFLKRKKKNRLEYQEQLARISAQPACVGYCGTAGAEGWSGFKGVTQRIHKTLHYEPVVRVR